MLKRYIYDNKKRDFSTASIWIKGGSDLDNFKEITQYIKRDRFTLVASPT